MWIARDDEIVGIGTAWIGHPLDEVGRSFALVVGNNDVVRSRWEDDQFHRLKANVLFYSGRKGHARLGFKHPNVDVVGGTLEKGFVPLQNQDGHVAQH